MVNSNDSVTDGDWFEITDTLARTIRFEFDDDMLDGRVGNHLGDGIAGTSDVPIVFNSVMTRRAVATQIVTAINQVTDAQLRVDAEAADHRITLRGDDGDGTTAATLPTNPLWSSFSIGIEGFYTDDGFKNGAAEANFFVIPIEETDDAVAIGTAIENVVNNTLTPGATLPAAAPVTWTGPNDFSGAEGHRVNFPWARGDGAIFLPGAQFTDATTGDGLTAGRNEHQVLTLTGAPTGGTFTLSYQGNSTIPIAYDATDFVVRNRLNSVGIFGLTVTGSGVGGTAPFDIVFTGTTNADELMIDTSGLTGDGDEGGDVSTLLNGSPVVASARLDNTDPTIPAAALAPMIVNIAADFSENEVRDALVAAINEQVSLANGAVGDANATARFGPARVALNGTWMRFDIAGTHDLEDGGPFYIVREDFVSGFGIPGANEEQRIQFNWDPNATPPELPPTGGVFDMTLTIPASLGGGSATVTLPWNATNIVVRDAINAAIGVGNVIVTAIGPMPANPIDVMFVGDWGFQNIASMTVDPGSLTGGSGFTMSVNTQVSGTPGTLNSDYYGVGPGYDLAHPPEPPVSPTTEYPLLNDTKVTGLAFVNHRLWAVDDLGGFYEVVSGFGGAFDPNSTRNELEYVTSSAADLMGIQFASLEAGPRNVDGNLSGEGPYANLLFGIDVFGDIYAFDLQGRLQPIFQDGTAVISTGIRNVQGLAFSNLDVNLWHDVNASGDMYFGFDTGASNANYPVDGIWDGFAGGEDYRIYHPNRYGTFNTNTYDFPGGAQGSIETDMFSLEGYSPEDRPYLYINYFLDTENATSGASPWYMRDAFRVFVAEDDGIWRPLATNNSSGSEFLYGFDVDMQEFYDIGDRGAPNSARQSRIPLEAFAGLDNLRLRIDFSTAGEFDIADPNTAGDELRGVQGWSIQDGDVFSIDGQIFEFDTDLTIAAPSGRKLADGQWFTLRDEGGTEVGFEFEDLDVAPTGITRDVQIDFYDSMSPAEIATAIFAAISGAAPIDVSMYRDGSLPNDGHLINIVNRTFDPEYELVYTIDPTLPVDFLAGSDGTTAGNVAVEIDRSMSDVQVATAVRTEVAATFNAPGRTADTSVVKRSDEIVRIINRSVDNSGPLGWTRRLIDDDPAEIEPGLQGDQFGAFEQGHDTPDFLRGRNNNQQGVRITSMTVGLAERGEQVGGATRNDNNATQFGSHPQGSSQTTEGTYQVEIRRAASPVNPGRSWNSNDRLAEQITLVAPAGYDIHDAQTFTVSDGVDTLTFEYEDLELRAGHVTQGLPFPGLSESGDSPPNPTAAAGPNDLLTMVDSQIALFDKTLGSQIDAGDLDTFFADVERAGISPESPWALYDRYSDRYIVAAREGANVLIAVSTSAAPDNLDLAALDNDDWYFYSIWTANQIREPKLAADADSIYVVGDNVVRLEKAPMLVGGAMAAPVERTPAGGQFLQPVMSVDRLAGDPQLFVEAYAEQGLRLWEMDAADNLTVVAILDAPYQAYDFVWSDVPQPDTTSELDAVGSRLMNAVWRDDSLWTVHTVNVGDEAKVRWYEIVTSGYSYTLRQQGDINPGAGIDTFMPAISVDAAGNVGFTYTQSSKAIYPTMMISGRDVDAPLGYTDPGVPVAVSETAYNPGGWWRESWGEYAGLALDPSDDATFWALHQTADTINTWTTWWTDFTIENTSTNVAGDIGVVQGNVAVPFRAEMTDDQVAEVIAAAINSPSVQSILDLRAGMADGVAPQLVDTKRTSNLVNLYGTAAADVTGSRNFGEVIDRNARILRTGTIPDDVIPFGDDTPSRYDLGDENLHREQGQVLIHSNVVSQSDNYGIVVDAGVRQTIRGPYDWNPFPYFDTEYMPHTGSARYLREINSENLSPGVVVANNIVSFNNAGGIRFSGDGTAGPQAPAPFGRIVNNTVYGNAQGDTGIAVDQTASPTLLNNVVANLATGINIDASSSGTIVGGTLYQDNGTNNPTGLGDFPMDLASGLPLFLTPTTGNFYPAPLSQVIDSSLSSLGDRTPFASVKSPLGLPPSPIIAPALDVTGHLRADDRAVDTPTGQGENVSIDRGAVDRNDFAGPTGELLNPVDNDPEGRDLDRSPFVVSLQERELENFAVLLLDENGTGIDSSTVLSEAVTLTQDGVMLTEGVDYTLGYNAKSNELRLTPLSEIWEPDRIYTISLNNRAHHQISFPDGNQLPDGTSFAIVNTQGARATFEFEIGYRMQVHQTLALQVPVAGGALGDIKDRQVFSLTNGTITRRFEFDRTSLNNGVDTNAIAIPFDVNDTGDDIAQTIADKIRAEAPELGLSPRGPNDAPYHDLGLGVVHLGALNNHTVDVSLAPALTVLGVPGVAIEDGDLFTIDDGSKFVTFELENTVIGDDVAAGNVAVNFRPFDTHEGIAQAIIDAIIAQKLGLAPENLGDGHIFVDGEQRHVLDTVVSPTNNTSLSQSGAPGVYPTLGLQLPIRAGQLVDLQDAETITIRNGMNPPVTFEFDNPDVLPGLVNVSRVRIPFDNNSTVVEVANAITTAILGTSVGLTPIYRGDGILDLEGSTSNHNLDLTDTTVTQRGTPGVDGAIPIVITPVATFDDTQVAVAAIEAINNEPLAVQASPGGGPVVVIEGATAVTELVPPSNPNYVPVFVTNGFFGAIKDLAGNDLQPNTPSGETQMTIVLGNVNMDFGDSPQTVVDYPAELGHNGPVHLIPRSPLFLGQRIDAEPDGQVSDNDANEDDDDSNNFGIDVANAGGNVTTTSATTPATITVGSVVDANYFSITTPVDTYDFEFEDTAVDNGTAAGHIPVLFDATMSQTDLAQAVIDAILDARLGIAATYFGGGDVELNGGDEDGVGIKGDFRPNPLTPTQITVTASAYGLLDAWIDFNRDGDFEDAGEQIFASQQLDAGDKAFLVGTPTDAVVGDTVARFRFSSTGGLKPTGLAVDGEVEDYWVAISNGIAPTATPDSYGAFPDTIDEDTPESLNVVVKAPADAPGAGGGPLEILIFDETTDLGARVSRDPSDQTKKLIYDPTVAPAIGGLGTSEQATDFFTYRVFDGKYTSAPATVTVTVTGVNDDPIAVNDSSIFTTQDAPIDINVLANDSDPEDGTVGLVVNSVSPNADADPYAGGVFIPTQTSRVHFDPLTAFRDLDAGEVRDDVFTYTIRDANGGVSNSATVTVTVSGIDDRPDAADDTFTTAEDAAKNLDITGVNGIFGNDNDPEGGVLTLVGVDSTITSGQVTVDVPNNTITYNPNGKFEDLLDNQTTRQDKFAYVVRDPQGNVARATVTMTITGVNDPPEAYNFVGPRVAENATVTFDVLAHTFDIDQGDTLTVDRVEGVADPVNGTASVASASQVTYDPNNAFNGLLPGEELTDRFAFVVRDAQGQEAKATVTVTVFGANDPPVANDDGVSPLITTTEDASVTINVLANDVNNNQPNPLSVIAIGNDPNRGGPPIGRVTIDPTAHSPNNAVIYSPDGQFDHLKSVNDTATDSFTYQVSDGASTDWGTVTVTITGVNDAPIANLDPNGYTVQRGGTLDVNAFADGVLFNDTDADDLQTDLKAVLKQGPQHAVTNGFTLSDNGTFTYIHNGNSATTDIFQYAAIDPQLAESQQIVTVVITITEPPPAEWQNPINRYDVNNDGSVSPIDVLLVINHINTTGSSVPAPPETPPPYVNVDGSVTVTGEETVTALDVLLVINEINRLNAIQSEGERVATAEGESAAPVPGVIDAPVTEFGSATTSQSVQLVSAEPLSASSNHVDEPVRDERSTLASRLDRSERTRDRAEETVHVDPFGVEDALSTIAAEVSGSQAGRTALDDVLEELLS